MPDNECHWCEHGDKDHAAPQDITGEYGPRPCLASGCNCDDFWPDGVPR